MQLARHHFRHKKCGHLLAGPVFSKLVIFEQKKNILCDPELYPTNPMVGQHNHDNTSWGSEIVE